MRDLDPDVAEFIIGRAFARPVGSSGLRLLKPKYTQNKSATTILFIEGLRKN